MGNIKISKLSLEELILLENKVDFNIFCTYIQNYLDNRFDKKEALSDNEIQQLNSLVQSIKLNNNVSLNLKNRIYENIIKLIVFSKNIDNQNFINRISDLKSLSLDELYLYLETTLKYSSFCLTKEYLRIIVNLFKNDYVYLKKIKKLLNDSKIDKVTKSTMNKVSLLLLFENNEDEFTVNDNVITLKDFVMNKGEYIVMDIFEYNNKIHNTAVNPRGYVTVRFLDEEGNDIVKSVSYYGKLGDTFEVYPRYIEGYKYDRCAGDMKDIYDVDSKSVIFIYTKM